MTSQDFSEGTPSTSLPNMGLNGSERASQRSSERVSEQLSETQPLNRQSEPAKFEELEEFSPSANGKARSRPSPKGWLSGGRGIFAGLGLGVLLTLGAVRVMTSQEAAQSDPTTAPAANATTAQSVTVATVGRSAITETIAASGTVNAADLLPVAAATPGLKIQQVLVQEGDQVADGQTLATLDNSILQAQLNQAQASLQSARSVIQQKQAALVQAQASANKAQSDANRYESLASQGAVSQQDLEGFRTTALTSIAAVEVAQSDIESARSTALSQEAAVQQLETQIGQTDVLAPASGLVAEKLASVGDVTGTEKLFSIIQDGALELDALVSADQLPNVRIGAPVRVTADNNPRIQLVGSVREISPLVNDQTRQATVKVDLPPSDQLRPGLFLKAAITTQSTTGLSVPAKAVIPQPDGSSQVFVLVGNKVQAKTVQVGATQTDASARSANADSPENASSSTRIAIRSGLEIGDRVVVDGVGYLKDGDSVTVASESTSSEGLPRNTPPFAQPAVPTAPTSPSSQSSRPSANSSPRAATESTPVSTAKRTSASVLPTSVPPASASPRPLSRTALQTDSQPTLSASAPVPKSASRPASKRVQNPLLVNPNNPPQP